MKAARIIGGAGTGKTSRLLEIMQRALDAGHYTPRDVGFVSFTKAARQEAAERAGTKFGVDPNDLLTSGWFRTVHSACFHLLGVKQGRMVTDSQKDAQWIAEKIGDAVSGAGDEEMIASGKTAADRALSLWATARNKMVPYAEVHSIAEHCEPRTPPLSYCRDVIEKYERGKWEDDRLDFTDLIANYAGYRFTFDGPVQTQATGDIPDVPVWFLDEQQDSSALLDAACRRLVSRARWVYMSLDPFQAIYGFNGASSKHAMSWPVEKEEVLAKSHRCPKAIGDLGEECLRRCSDYWDRGIQPGDHDGEICREEYESPWWELIDSRHNESWLILARTNFIAQRLAQRISAHNIPWVYVDGRNNQWAAPVRNAAAEALHHLQRGAPIDINEWKAILNVVSGRELFVRGTKKQWENRSDFNGDRFALMDINGLDQWGATDAFKRLVLSGRWMDKVEHAREYLAAKEKYGWETVTNPKVRIGTIHSAKGMEADNVVIMRTITQQVAMGREIEEIADEEHRLAYVAVTRARRRVIILTERNKPFHMEV